MDTPTVLEVEVERDAVASVLDAVPGVAVVDDVATDPIPTGPESPDDGPGLTDRLAAVWHQWGLLGTGLSLIALGAATAGLWWYRRRNADDTDGAGMDDYATEWDTDSAVDTPASSESAVDTPSPTDSGFEPTAPAEDADDTSMPEPQEPALASDTTPSRSGDRRQYTGSGTDRAAGAGAESEADTLRQDEPERDESDADERPEAKIDPAPLLGAAFLIVTSAIGRWVTRERSAET
jgi:hypothetical protein